MVLQSHSSPSVACTAGDKEVSASSSSSSPSSSSSGRAASIAWDVVPASVVVATLDCSDEDRALLCTGLDRSREAARHAVAQTNPMGAAAINALQKKTLENNASTIRSFVQNPGGPLNIIAQRTRVALLTTWARADGATIVHPPPGPERTPPTLRGGSTGGDAAQPPKLYPPRRRHPWGHRPHARNRAPDTGRPPPPLRRSRLRWLNFIPFRILH